MKTLFALVVIIILALPVVSTGELTLEEKKVIRNYVQKVNTELSTIKKECEDQVDNLEKDCEEKYVEVIKQLEEAEQRLDKIEKELCDE